MGVWKRLKDKMTETIEIQTGSSDGEWAEAIRAARLEEEKRRRVEKAEEVTADEIEAGSP